ncbi:hypothetical protein [Macrococcus capreoli]|uniref:hypothetical protein n=1 Tax=Macrococcus capreoli TaxID=2982690 RepID=UPI003EE715B0
MNYKVKPHYDYIVASNSDVLRFVNTFDWEALPGTTNKSYALRMAIVHALGEMNYNQEKLFETRNLNWDDIEYNRLFKETIEIQRKLQAIIASYPIDENNIKKEIDIVKRGKSNFHEIFVYNLFLILLSLTSVAFFILGILKIIFNQNIFLGGILLIMALILFIFQTFYIKIYNNHNSDNP